jgi:hypothetical protein
LESSPEEQMKIAEEFNERVNSYMDPELKSITGNAVEKTAESKDITKDDEDRVKELDEVTKALENYPDLPEAQKKSVEDMIYSRVDNVQGNVAEVLSQNQPEDKSDRNIEE